MDPSLQLCADDRLSSVTSLAAEDTAAGLTGVDALLAEYPQDPRLHFLQGSLRAALRRFDEAVEPMTTAVRLAPAFHIARFQLGLLHLTSGRPSAATEVWEPLENLEPEAPLRLFAAGFRRLANDEFTEAERLLRAGISRNAEYPELNTDAEMVLRALPRGEGAEDASSEAHWLLHLSRGRTTTH